MTRTANDEWLAGVDGCPGGWIAAFVRGAEVRVEVLPRFADVLARGPALVVVDIPIGLPELGGRAAENEARTRLGKLKRSVFSVCSRRAAYADIGPYLNQQERSGGHQRACAVARATSAPPKGMSIQTFCILPKIREVDQVLRDDPTLVQRVFETHPEVAFWRLNGERALEHPKKKAPGLARRRSLLVGAGFPAAVVSASAPKGAGPDDLLDALACAFVAKRLRDGSAQPLPDPPGRDAYGLPMAIWA